MDCGLGRVSGSSECSCDVPGLSVSNQTLAAAVAPPAGGAGVVGGEAADAAEVSGRQRGGRGRRRQVVGLRLLRQVLPIRGQRMESQQTAHSRQPIRTQQSCVTHLLLQQRREVLPETLLKVIAPRLPLLLLWRHRHRRRRRRRRSRRRSRQRRKHLHSEHQLL